MPVGPSPVPLDGPTLCSSSPTREGLGLEADVWGRLRVVLTLSHSLLAMTRLSAWMWLFVGGLAVLAAHAHAAGPKADVIEDVNAKQLEDLVAESDYVAVFWCKCSVEVWGDDGGEWRRGTGVSTVQFDPASTTRHSWRLQVFFTLNL